MKPGEKDTALSSLGLVAYSDSESDSEESGHKLLNGSSAVDVQGRNLASVAGALPKTDEGNNISIGVPVESNQNDEASESKISFENSSELEVMDGDGVSQSALTTENTECSVKPENVPVDYTSDAFTEIRIDCPSKRRSETSDSESDSSSSDNDTSDTLTDSEEEAIKLTHKRNGPRVKGEQRLCDLPPIEDLHISVPHEECKRIGTVKSFVDPLVIVAGDVGSPALDLDSVLFLEEGDRALGKIFDVFGPVKQPHYCVRFNSKTHIDSLGITPGMIVYCAPETPHSTFVLVAQLKQFRGTDASWKDDIEPPPEVQEFSDDEMEAFAKKGGRRRVRCRGRGNMNSDFPDSQTDIYGDRGRKRQFGHKIFTPVEFNSYNPQNNAPGFSSRGQFHRGRGRGYSGGAIYNNMGFSSAAMPRPRFPASPSPQLYAGQSNNESQYWSEYWRCYYSQNPTQDFYNSFLQPPPPPPPPPPPRPQNSDIHREPVVYGPHLPSNY